MPQGRLWWLSSVASTGRTGRGTKLEVLHEAVIARMGLYASAVERYGSAGEAEQLQRPSASSTIRYVQ